jgi:hypothetical protein
VGDRGYPSTAFKEMALRSFEKDIPGPHSWQETCLASKKIYTHFKEMEK